MQCVIEYVYNIPCSQDWECRDEDDMIIIERILLLIRNILHIPTEASEEQVCVSH